MQKLTQTRPDNCLQTCAAALLDCAVESLPAQHELAHEAFIRALRVFLDKHHSLTYVEAGPEMFATAKMQLAGKPHILIGPSPRTTPENDSWHAVIAVDGEMVWDVNSSRAGLTEVRAWGLLVPTPREWRAMWAGEACRCPECKVQSRGAA